jgi:hypothetical protein
MDQEARARLGDYFAEVLLDDEQESDLLLVVMPNPSDSASATSD